MVQHDSMAYRNLHRIIRKHLQWIGLSDAARDILSSLLVEFYWTHKPLSTDDLVELTGYSRGSISVAVSQLKSLGFIESRVITSHSGPGRRPVLYELTDGISGIVMFAVRRVSIELEGLLREIEGMRLSMDDSEFEERSSLAWLQKETERNLDHIRKYLRQIIASEALSKTSELE